MHRISEGRRIVSIAINFSFFFLICVALMLKSLVQHSEMSLFIIIFSVIGKRHNMLLDLD